MNLMMLATAALLCASAAYGFTCPEDSHTFYHADVSTGCQVYHLCENGQLQTLTCQSGTAFNQATSLCEDVSTVNCYETMDSHNMHHHHKRSVEEYHTINIQAVKDKMVELYKNIKPQLISAAKEVAPSVYSKFEIEYLPYIKSVKQEVMPFVHENILPRVKKGMEYVKRYASRLVEKIYKCYELSNSTHITIVSMTDLASDVTNDMKPVIELGRFLSARLLPTKRAKRSFEIPEFLSAIYDKSIKYNISSAGKLTPINENNLTNQVFLPILEEIRSDNETKSDVTTMYKNTFRAMFNTMQIFRRPYYEPAAGVLVGSVEHDMNILEHELRSLIQPIVQRIFKKHFANVMKIISENVPVIMGALDSMNFAPEQHVTDFKYELVNFLRKYEDVYKSTSSLDAHPYTLDEVERDLTPVRVSLKRLIPRVFARVLGDDNEPDDSLVNRLIGIDSVFFKLPGEIH